MAQDEMAEERRRELRDVGFKTLQALAERASDVRVRLDAAIELLNHTDDGGPKPTKKYYPGSSHVSS